MHAEGSGNKLITAERVVSEYKDGLYERALDKGVAALDNLTICFYLELTATNDLPYDEAAEIASEEVAKRFAFVYRTSDSPIRYETILKLQEVLGWVSVDIESGLRAAAYPDHLMANLQLACESIVDTIPA